MAGKVGAQKKIITRTVDLEDIRRSLRSELSSSIVSASTKSARLSAFSRNEASRKSEDAEQSRVSSLAAEATKTATTIDYYGFCESSWLKPFGFLNLCPERFPFEAVKPTSTTLSASFQQMAELNGMDADFDNDGVTTDLAAVTSTTTFTATDTTTAWSTSTKTKKSTSKVTTTLWDTSTKNVQSTVIVEEPEYVTQTKPVTSTITSYDEYLTTVEMPTTITRTVYLPEETAITVGGSHTIPWMGRSTVTKSETVWATEITTLTQYAGTGSQDGTVTGYGPGPTVTVNTHKHSRPAAADISGSLEAWTRYLVLGQGGRVVQVDLNNGPTLWLVRIIVIAVMIWVVRQWIAWFKARNNEDDETGDGDSDNGGDNGDSDNGSDDDKGDAKGGPGVAQKSSNEAEKSDNDRMGESGDDQQGSAGSGARDEPPDAHQAETENETAPIGEDTKQQRLSNGRVDDNGALVANNLQNTDNDNVDDPVDTSSHSTPFAERLRRLSSDSTDFNVDLTEVAVKLDRESRRLWDSTKAQRRAQETRTRAEQTQDFDANKNDGYPGTIHDGSPEREEVMMGRTAPNSGVLEDLEDWIQNNAYNLDAQGSSPTIGDYQDLGPAPQDDEENGVTEMDVPLDELYAHVPVKEYREQGKVQRLVTPGSNLYVWIQPEEDVAPQIWHEMCEGRVFDGLNQYAYGEDAEWKFEDDSQGLGKVQIIPYNGRTRRDEEALSEGPFFTWLGQQWSEECLVDPALFTLASVGNGHLIRVPLDGNGNTVAGEYDEALKRYEEGEGLVWLDGEDLSAPGHNCAEEERKGAKEWRPPSTSPVSEGEQSDSDPDSPSEGHDAGGIAENGQGANQDSGAEHADDSPIADDKHSPHTVGNARSTQEEDNTAKPQAVANQGMNPVESNVDKVANTTLSEVDKFEHEGSPMQSAGETSAETDDQQKEANLEVKQEVAKQGLTQQQMLSSFDSLIVGTTTGTEPPHSSKHADSANLVSPVTPSRPEKDEALNSPKTDQQNTGQPKDIETKIDFDAASPKTSPIAAVSSITPSTITQGEQPGTTDAVGGDTGSYRDASTPGSETSSSDSSSSQETTPRVEDPEEDVQMSEPSSVPSSQRSSTGLTAPIKAVHLDSPSNVPEKDQEDTNMIDADDLFEGEPDYEETQPAESTGVGEQTPGDSAKAAQGDTDAEPSAPDSQTPKSPLLKPEVVPLTSPTLEGTDSDDSDELNQFEGIYSDEEEAEAPKVQAPRPAAQGPKPKDFGSVQVGTGNLAAEVRRHQSQARKRRKPKSRALKVAAPQTKQDSSDPFSKQAAKDHSETKEVRGTPESQAPNLTSRESRDIAKPAAKLHENARQERKSFTQTLTKLDTDLAAGAPNNVSDNTPSTGRASPRTSKPSQPKPRRPTLGMNPPSPEAPKSRLPVLIRKSKQDSSNRKTSQRETLASASPIEATSSPGRSRRKSMASKSPLEAGSSPRTWSPSEVWHPPGLRERSYSGRSSGLTPASADDPRSRLPGMTRKHTTSPLQEMTTSEEE